MRHEFPFNRFEGILHRIYATFLFRRRFREFGKGAFVSPYAMLYGMEDISIGPDSFIGTRSLITAVPQSDGQRSSITIGRHSRIARGCTISACGKFVMGDEVGVGDNAYMSAGQHSFSDFDTRVDCQPMQTGELIIEDGAWIGYAAFISTTSSLTIGKGSLVAANAVVTKSVPPYTMVAGSPARPIKQFDFEKNDWVSIPKPAPRP